MNLSKDVFKDSLPLVLVEKVAVQPQSGKQNARGATGTEAQRIDITLSVQRQEKVKLLPYRIFVGFTNEYGLINKMTTRDSFVKGLIKNPSSHGKIRKRFLKPGQKSDKNVYEYGRTSSGATMLKESIQVTELFDPRDVRNLYLYAVAYAIDPQSVSISGVNSPIASMRISLPVSETLMVDGKVANNSVIYTLKEDAPGFGKEGDVWTGPTHNMGDKVCAGKPGPGEAHPVLSINIVPNQKIHDLRFLRIANNLPFTTVSKGAENNRKNVRLTETIRKVVSTAPAISDATYSRTSLGAVKIMFSIDRSKMCFENTRLGKLITNNVSRLSTLRIENIRVYRTRTLPGNNSTKLTAGKSTTKGSSSRISTDKLVATLQDGSVRSLQIESMNKSVLNFVINDESITQENVGTFEYTVYVDIVDKSVDVIESMAGNLHTSLKKYNSYVKNIEISTGRAKGDQLKSLVKQRSSNFLESSDDWLNLIEQYIASVHFLFGDRIFTQFSMQTWKNNLSAMASPSDGDVISINKVAEIVQNFYTNLVNSYKPATKQGSESSFSAQSSIGRSGSGTRKIVIEKKFKQKYVKSKTNAEGIDYLDDTMTANNTVNMTNISFKNLEKRVAQEVQKYGVQESRISGINTFGYLSPKRIKTIGGIIETSVKDIPQEAGNGILASNLNPTINTGLFYPSNIPDKVFEIEADLLLNYADVSIKPLKRPIESFLIGKTDKVVSDDKDKVSTKYLSEDSEFNKNIITKTASISGSLEEIIKSGNSRKANVLKSGLVSELINAKSINFKSTPTLNNMEFMADSLAANDIMQKGENLTTDNNFANTINYNSVVELQVFKGHKVTNGTTNINDMKWETLTQPEFERLKASGQPVLCRNKTINNAIQAPNNYKMPELDGLFILGDSAPPPKVVNLPSSQEIIENTIKTIKKDVSIDLKNTNTNVDISYAKTPLIRSISNKK